MEPPKTSQSISACLVLPFSRIWVFIGDCPCFGWCSSSLTLANGASEEEPREEAPVAAVPSTLRGKRGEASHYCTWESEISEGFSVRLLLSAGIRSLYLVLTSSSE